MIINPPACQMCMVDNERVTEAYIMIEQVKRAISAAGGCASHYLHRLDLRGQGDGYLCCLAAVQCMKLSVSCP